MSLSSTSLYAGSQLLWSRSGKIGQLRLVGRNARTSLKRGHRLDAALRVDHVIQRPWNAQIGLAPRAQ